MDLWTIGGSIATFVLGIGVVAKFANKIIPAAVKYANIAKEALDLVTQVLGAVTDGKISDEEIIAIKREAEELKAALKK